MDASVARTMWQVTEPYHAVVYFAPETRAAYDEAGLKGYWMGYFASRSAALGPVPPEVVTAAFYGFHPSMVHRALPDAWTFSSPQAVQAARLAGVDAALRRILGDDLDGPALQAAAQLARRAAEHCQPAGRVLFAAHAALDWPDAPHLVLWHAATLLREFRGDGHVAALLAAGIDPCEAHVLAVATGAIDRASLQPFRGWSDEEWAAASARLRSRAFVDAEGRLTTAGAAARQAVEDSTDELALPPWGALGEDACAGLRAHLVELLPPVLEEVPFPNPMGVPRPVLVAAPGPETAPRQ